MYVKDERLSRQSFDNSFMEELIKLGSFMFNYRFYTYFLAKVPSDVSEKLEVSSSKLNPWKFTGFTLL